PGSMGATCTSTTSATSLSPMTRRGPEGPLLFSFVAWSVDQIGLDDDDVVGAFFALLGGAEQAADDGEVLEEGHSAGGEGDAIAQHAAEHDGFTRAERDGGVEVALVEAEASEAAEVADEVAEGALDVEGDGAVGADERLDGEEAAEVDDSHLVFPERNVQLTAAVEGRFLVVVDADAELVDGAGEALLLERLERGGEADVVDALEGVEHQVEAAADDV